jgi:hypothetical protein
VLDEYTLSDLVRPRAPLQALLAIEPKPSQGLSAKRRVTQTRDNG